MQVAIDIRLLAKGARTGIEEYTTSLLSYLLPIRKDINYKIFYNALRKTKLNYPWLNLENVELKEFSFPNRVFDTILKYFSFPKIDKLVGGCDVFFSPHFFIAPTSKKCKKIVVFHDLSFEHHPEFFSFSKKYWHFSMNPKKTAREADKIIAVSESTKADLVNLYKITPEKIEVIYPGVSELFKPIGQAEQDYPARIKQKYNLPDNFILYFGTIEPRKNIIGLIKAFERLKNIKTQEHKNIKLVIAGAKGWLYKNILKEARNSKYAKDIIFTGFVDEKNKPYLYNLATIFVYPSFFEGFGFPPLEAMACGVPVVASNRTSLPEVVEEGAIMIDPYNIDEIRWAMQLFLEDEKLRNIFKQRGIEQAKKFSWQDSARKILDTLLNC